VHLRKFERYVVVEGQAEIALRRLFTDQVVRFLVTGERPAIVDMPTLWAHRITALGESPVTTFFWTNEVYDPADPDTYACPVLPDRSGVEGDAP
jgi:UDP-2-acetamido-2,6-beta-L-arabino-hexul-4-ose reductase